MFRLPVLLLLFCLPAFGQDPLRFKKEVEDIKKQNPVPSKKNLNLFTGSSSIRLWGDIRERFHDHHVINTGFGGSLMSELNYYAPELITGFKPKRVFIYEGDNDLSEGKTPDDIINDAEKLLKVIRYDLGKKAKVFFITPKPSISRWHLKAGYEEYIRKLKSWASKQKNVGVIDVWSPMLDGNGELRRDLFVEDGLHMNTKGYDIWEKVIRPCLKKR